MGNSDNWTTPKQIKIEREGEPRGTRRGSLKKGKRRKGRKARMDEVLAAYRNWQTYKKWYDTSTATESWWRAHMKENAEKARTRYEALRDAFTKDYPLQ